MPIAASEADDLEIALKLAELLSSGRSVIYQNQKLINDPTRMDKSLTGDFVVEKASALFEAVTGKGVRSFEPGSRIQRLLDFQIAAIREVVDEHQSTINKPGIAYKGFVPAVLGMSRRLLKFVEQALLVKQATQPWRSVQGQG